MHCLNSLTNETKMNFNDNARFWEMLLQNSISSGVMHHYTLDEHGRVYGDGKCVALFDSRQKAEQILTDAGWAKKGAFFCTLA